MLKSKTLSFDNFVDLLKFKFQDETGYLADTLQQNTKRIIIKYGSIDFEVNQDFFHLKLRHTIDEFFQHPDSYKINCIYNQTLNLCLASKLAFQSFYRTTAIVTIKYGYVANIQTFLEQLIVDLRIRQPSMEHFCKMYSNDMLYYVKILSDVCYCSTNMLPDYPVLLLRNLQSKDKLKFVILTTHFKKFNYLFKS